MEEQITTYMWDPSSEKEIELTVDLEHVIRNPSGFRMDHIGLILFNRERRVRGLTEFRLNPATGTIDEIPS